MNPTLLNMLALANTKVRGKNTQRTKQAMGELVFGKDVELHHTRSIVIAGPRANGEQSAPKAQPVNKTIEDGLAEDYWSNWPKLRMRLADLFSFANKSGFEVADFAKHVPRGRRVAGFQPV